MTTRPDYIVPMLTGPAAEREMNRISGVVGSRESIFFPTLMAAQHGYNTPGRLAPPSAAGLSAWIGGTEELRIRLSAFGWKVPNGALDNAGLVVSPDDRVAIAMVAGDEMTGKDGYPPQVKYARGLVATTAVQGSLFSGFDESDPMTLYFLLHRITRDQAWAELSLPTGITSSGLITGWRPRVHIDCDTGGRGPEPIGKVDGRVVPELPAPKVQWRESA